MFGQVRLDSIAWVKGHEPGGRKTPILRFNALIYLDLKNFLAIKGFRIRDGRIDPPVTVQGRVEYPTVYIPRVLGGPLVDAVLNSQLLRERHPEIFPMLDRDVLIYSLEYDKKFSRRDFPNCI